jgi:anti-sigma-K factor RskA
MSVEIDIHHLSGAYTLDALDDDERAAFETHYPSCAVCAADVADFRDTLALMAAESATPPPDSLKSRVMAEIAETRQLSPLSRGHSDEVAARREHRNRRRLMTGGMLVAAAAVIAVVAGTIVSRDDGSRYATAFSDVMASSDGRVVTLTAQPTAGGDGGVVKVAWSATLSTVTMMADGLPEAPAGMAYELWLIGSQGPIPIQVLDPAGDGKIRAVGDVVVEPTAWGVTLEPESGSTLPTTDILYLALV